jgi:rRNA pseudouridine-1189 N-methylase Emg1 (Nep1/Mra1 family)
MLYIILADSALEMVPTALKGHPSVEKNIKKYGDAGKLLDIAYHHSAMTSLPDHMSRGRPDIIHHFLIDSLSSILNKWNLLRLYVHTRIDNSIYEISPLMRPPKDYNRFKGVMFNLLKDGILKIQNDEQITRGGFITPDSIDKVHDKDPVIPEFLRPLTFNQIEKNNAHGPSVEFLEVEHFNEQNDIVLARRMRKLGTVTKLVEFLRPDKVFLLDNSGKLLKQSQLFTKCSQKEHVVVIIGGFQSGEFSPAVLNPDLGYETVSIFPENIESWTVIQRIIVNYENRMLDTIGTPQK